MSHELLAMLFGAFSAVCGLLVFLGSREERKRQLRAEAPDEPRRERRAHIDKGGHNDPPSTPRPNIKPPAMRPPKRNIGEALQAAMAENLKHIRHEHGKPNAAALPQVTINVQGDIIDQETLAKRIHDAIPPKFRMRHDPGPAIRFSKAFLEFEEAPICPVCIDLITDPALVVPCTGLILRGRDQLWVCRSCFDSWEKPMPQGVREIKV